MARALARSGLEPDVTSEPERVRTADAVVLPGAGAFADAMSNLRAKGLDEAVVDAIEAGRPYLGLCLGLQVLFEESEEHGPVRGLAVLRGRVVRFAETGEDGRRRPVPHIGWNEVCCQGPHPMLAALPERDRYYFVHSYHVVPADPGLVVGTTDYGGPVVSAVARERVFAVQFHPEKSQTAGRRLLDAFASWVASCRA